MSNFCQPFDYAYMFASSAYGKTRISPDPNNNNNNSGWRSSVHEYPRHPELAPLVHDSDRYSDDYDNEPHERQHTADYNTKLHHVRDRYTQDALCAHGPTSQDRESDDEEDKEGKEREQEDDTRPSKLPTSRRTTPRIILVQPESARLWSILIDGLRLFVLSFFMVVLVFISIPVETSFYHDRENISFDSWGPRALLSFIGIPYVFIQSHHHRLIVSSIFNNNNTSAYRNSLTSLAHAFILFSMTIILNYIIFSVLWSKTRVILEDHYVDIEDFSITETTTSFHADAVQSIIIYDTFLSKRLGTKHLTILVQGHSSALEIEHLRPTELDTFKALLFSSKQHYHLPPPEHS